jgi:hypothetical protein
MLMMLKTLTGSLEITLRAVYGLSTILTQELSLSDLEKSSLRSGDG